MCVPRSVRSREVGPADAAVGLAGAGRVDDFVNDAVCGVRPTVPTGVIGQDRPLLRILEQGQYLVAKAVGRGVGAGKHPGCA